MDGTGRKWFSPSLHWLAQLTAVAPSHSHQLDRATGGASGSLEELQVRVEALAKAEESARREVAAAESRAKAAESDRDHLAHCLRHSMRRTLHYSEEAAKRGKLCGITASAHASALQALRECREGKHMVRVRRPSGAGGVVKLTPRSTRASSWAGARGGSGAAAAGGRGGEDAGLSGGRGGAVATRLWRQERCSPLTGARPLTRVRRPNRSALRHAGGGCGYERDRAGGAGASTAGRAGQDMRA